MTDNRAFKQRARLESKITGDKYSVTIEKLRSRAEEFTLWNLLSDADYVNMLGLLNRKSGLTLFTGIMSKGKDFIMAAALNHEIINNKETIVIDNQLALELFFARDNARKTRAGEKPMSKGLMDSLETRGYSSMDRRDKISLKEQITNALRADPNHIVVGEIRNTSVMEGILRATDTGHHVLATMFTGIEFAAKIHQVMGPDKTFPVTGIIQTHPIYVDDVGFLFLRSVIPMNYEAVALLEQGRTKELDELFVSQGIKTVAAKLQDLVQQGTIVPHPHKSSYFLPEK